MKLNKNSYTFREIKTDKYSKFIYKINNAPDVRKFSIKKNKFSFSSHSKWFKNALKNKKEKIFLTMFNGKIVGIIREKIFKNKNYLSWVIIKKFRGQNHGKKMLKKYTAQSKRNCYAKIHKNNISSIKMSKFAGFKKTRQDNKFITFKKNINIKNL